MNENFQKIIIAVVVMAVVVVGFILYRQQKTISSLSKAIATNEKTSSTGSLANLESISKNGSGASLVEQQKKGMEDSTMFIAGTVAAVSENTITVEANMPDWDKMKEIASSANSADKPRNAPTYKKTYKVSVNSETQFIIDKLDSIKVGNTIHITSKELIYQTDKLTAVSIISPFKEPNL